jgi:squalene-hopene/tetraprenyl-beta-curcumene cyclase
MRSLHTRVVLPLALVILASPTVSFAQPYTKAKQEVENPFPYTPNEAKAKEFSLANTAEYLDGVARFWMKSNSCGTCHANFAYVMARPLLGGNPDALLAETRKFLEGYKPHDPKRFSSDSHAVSVAFTLAWDDARNGGKLQPSTRKALQRMWTLQHAGGFWEPMGCGEFLPAETDLYSTMLLAALAAGIAPDDYARSADAKDGLTKLRRYITKHPPHYLHSEAMLLWASLHVDGLMTTAERQATVKKLLARQGKDGGWSYHALVSELSRRELLQTPSDGYPTGFVVYVLREAGVPANRDEIARGIEWLRANQRASGRWFTPAPVGQPIGKVGSRDLYAQNLGTAFAILALHGYDEAKAAAEQAERRAIRGASGLLLRAGLLGTVP